jgi:hypothetical protein
MKIEYILCLCSRIHAFILSVPRGFWIHKNGMECIMYGTCKYIHKYISRAVQANRQTREMYG